MKYIEKIGGMSPYECVKRAYSRILSDDVAIEYNWNGMKKKKNFALLGWQRLQRVSCISFDTVLNVYFCQFLNCKYFTNKC